MGLRILRYGRANWEVKGDMLRVVAMVCCAVGKGTESDRVRVLQVDAWSTPSIAGRR